MERNILLFDGFCPLCSSLVRFIARRDRSRSIHFAALSSEVGQQLLQEQGLNSPSIDTVVWIDKKGARTESDAVLEVVRRLSLPWTLLRVFRILPRGWRNRLYRFFADRRGVWWVRRNSCFSPDPALKTRFLD